MSTFHIPKKYFGHLPNFFFLLISPCAVLHIPIRMSANLNIWLNTLCIVFTPFHFLKNGCFSVTSSRLGTALTALQTSSMNRFVFLLQLACLTIQKFRKQKETVGMPSKTKVQKQYIPENNNCNKALKRFADRNQTSPDFPPKECSL